MVSFTLYLLVASTATILAHPTRPTGAHPPAEHPQHHPHKPHPPHPTHPPGGHPPTDGKGLRIVSVLHGKDAIKAFVDENPSVPYQLFGDGDPTFPRPATGQPGTLQILGVLHGMDAIANFVSESHVPVRVLGGASNGPDSHRSPEDGGLPSPEEQALVNSGLLKPIPYRIPDPPQIPETYEEQLADWNSGLRTSPPDEWLKPAAASNPRNPLVAQDPPGQKRQETYEEQLEAWNSGLRNTPPDSWLKPTIAPSNNRNPLSQQQPPPKREETYEEQLEAWNSGLRNTPPDSWLKPKPVSAADESIIARSTLRSVQLQPSLELVRKPPRQDTYDEQLAAWNSGLRNTPPDASLLPSTTAKPTDTPTEKLTENPTENLTFI